MVNDCALAAELQHTTTRSVATERCAMPELMSSPSKWITVLATGRRLTSNSCEAAHYCLDLETISSYQRHGARLLLQACTRGRWSYNAPDLFICSLRVRAETTSYDQRDT